MYLSDDIMLTDAHKLLIDHSGTRPSRIPSIRRAGVRASAVTCAYRQGWEQRVDSHHRPLGYEPSALLLRHSATDDINLTSFVFAANPLVLFRSEYRSIASHLPTPFNTTPNLH